MYYPQERYATEMMRLRRRTMLPDTAIGNVRVEQGQVVDVRDTVARGLVPQRHIILDAMKELNLRKAEELDTLLLAPMNRPITKGTVIAGKDANRGRRVFAPVDGLVVHVDKGRIIMQEMPQIIKLEAGVRGQVIQVHQGRGVSIEATGGVIQGVWGNDQHVIATLRLEPEGGIQAITRDELDSSYRGEILVLKNPITVAAFEIGQIRSVAGILAPSMDASLIDLAMTLDFAIMLTAGFGSTQMSRHVLQILEVYNGYQAVMDAALPRRFDERRPELMVHRIAHGEKVELREPTPLELGMMVRVVREPYLGQMGRITELPHLPVLLSNGLRVMVARVELGLEENVDIPLANIELAGE